MKYLVIGDTQMFENLTLEEFILSNATNIGNCMFPLGTLSLIADPNIPVALKGFREFGGGPNLKGEEFERLLDDFNSYDCIVAPFPDKLRARSKEYFKVWNKILPKLKTRFVLTSIGVFPDTKRLKRSEDDMKEEKKFFEYVFDHQDTINVRDKNTKNYILGFGFPEDRIEVLGCPSMYTMGPKLPTPSNDITENSKVVINANLLAPRYRELGNHGIFFLNSTKKFKDYKYICTRNFEGYFLNCIKEKGTYDEQDFLEIWDDPGIKKSINLWNTEFNCKTEPFRKAVYPLNINSWMSEISGYDFCFGSRIHACIMSILMGIPTFVVCIDGRMLGLCETHNIPHIDARDLQKDTDVFSLIKDVDFNQINDGQEERFWSYIKFLNRNGIKTIHDNGVVETPPFMNMIKKFPSDSVLKL